MIVDKFFTWKITFSDWYLMGSKKITKIVLLVFVFAPLKVILLPMELISIFTVKHIVEKYIDEMDNLMKYGFEETRCVVSGYWRHKFWIRYWNGAEKIFSFLRKFTT